MAIRFKNEEDRKHYLKYIGNSSLHKSDSQSGEVEAYNQAVQTIRDIQSVMSDSLSRDYLGIELIVEGKTTADIDNVFKGVADSLQGVLYENDKQIKKGYFEHKDY